MKKNSPEFERWDVEQASLPGISAPIFQESWSLAPTC